MHCRMCGREIAPPKKVWCGKTCSNRWRHKVPSSEITCQGCGKRALVPSAQRYRRKYCGKRCSDRHHNTQHFKGPNNPRWKGGKVLSYGPDWKRVKQQIRERDQVCRGCGKTPEDNGRALDVHHVRPYRFSGDNSPGNLIALCRSCHMRCDDHGRSGSARFAGPVQPVLRPPSQREQRRRRGAQRGRRRAELQREARELRLKGLSLRKIARQLGVSHQTVADWLSLSGPPAR